MQFPYVDSALAYYWSGDVPHPMTSRYCRKRAARPFKLAHAWDDSRAGIGATAFSLSRKVDAILLDSGQPSQLFERCSESDTRLRSTRTPESALVRARTLRQL